jgi:hypothetical protein
MCLVVGMEDNHCVGTAERVLCDMEPDDLKRMLRNIDLWPRTNRNTTGFHNHRPLDVPCVVRA